MTIAHWRRYQIYKPLQIHLYSLTSYSLSGNKHCWFTFQTTWYCYYISSPSQLLLLSKQLGSLLLNLLRNPPTHLVFFRFCPQKDHTQGISEVTCCYSLGLPINGILSHSKKQLESIPWTRPLWSIFYLLLQTNLLQTYLSFIYIYKNGLLLSSNTPGLLPS